MSRSFIRGNAVRVSPLDLTTKTRSRGSHHLDQWSSFNATRRFDSDPNRRRQTRPRCKVRADSFCNLQAAGLVRSLINLSGLSPSPILRVHTKYIKRCLPWCTRQSCASLNYDTDNCLAVPPTQVLVATAVWHQSLYSAITLKLQLQLSIMSLWLLPCVMPQHVDQGLEAHYCSRAALSN